ncbi:hypothetical protein ETG59_05185 [Proteus mirabilis]|nr:hypothetical protein [Proteus mirabilis]MBN7153489.1 hypothetical protein [Proteus mirabilis]MBN7166252.1 hypothetical protein [Proteus mirabilis]MBN7170320.1 hypothetical protein [Proteus mirabilis]MBN7185403.1 hypothetical protein [Proteus mirabilis]
MINIRYCYLLLTTYYLLLTTYYLLLLHHYQQTLFSNNRYYSYSLVLCINASKLAFISSSGR